MPKTAGPPTAAAPLQELLARQDELAGVARDAATAATFGSQQLLDARRQVEIATRRHLIGDVDAQTLAEAEARLAEAEEAALTPWVQRQVGAQAALTDADHVVSASSAALPGAAPDAPRAGRAGRSGRR
jgi:hypothetical protein